MCSIFGIFNLQPSDNLQILRHQALECSQRQRHRGPDWSGVYVDVGAILVHERLAIVDPAGGAQPLFSEDGTLALAVNGEIYNHAVLKGTLQQPYAFQTHSDCEVINALYREETPTSFLNRLNGILHSHYGTRPPDVASSHAIQWAWCRCTGGTIRMVAYASRQR